jgi:tRNA modification GTPase
MCKAQREAAIVTAIPGTTRDVLEISLDIEGLPVVVADTAGLRTADDMVERIGIQRAAEAYVLYSGFTFTFTLYKWPWEFA